MPLIECVPNISEGRRADLVEKWRVSLQRVPGLHVLDVHRDATHHRSVFTLAAEPAALTRGLLLLAEHVIASVDLRTHAGAHPRIGALDVVPFIPLTGASMDDCVHLAREVGAALAAQCHVPVYLYEAAASRPERQRLEVVRRGQFEGLDAKLCQPDWAPDFGPGHRHPTAGAIAVGARPILVAFNMQLATDRLEVARTVAAAVRESSGGLPHVKAMGLRLPERGVVQVSMNLTRVMVTSLRTVFAAVEAEARRHGVEVLDSELVGLLPEAALADVTLEALRVPAVTPAPTIEARLAVSAAGPGR